MFITTSLTKSMSAKGCLTITRGSVMVATALGQINVPFRIMTMKRDGKFGAPFIGIDGEAKYNGQRSWFSPWIDDEMADTLKGLLPAMPIYKATKAIGDGYEIQLELTSEGVAFVSKKARGSGIQLDDRDQSEFLALADELQTKAAATPTTGTAFTQDNSIAAAILGK